MADKVLKAELLAHKLRSEIAMGVYEVDGGEPFTVRAITEKHNLSVNVVLQALRLLKDQGVVILGGKDGYAIAKTKEQTLAVPGLNRPPKPEQGRTSADVDLAGEEEKSWFVRRMVRDTQKPGLINFGAAVVHPKLLPVTALNQIAARRMREEPVRTAAYDFPPGCDALREAIADVLMSTGSRQFSPDEIITTCGCTEALVLSIETAIHVFHQRKGTRPKYIAIETPTYYGFLLIARSLGLTPLEIATDSTNGMDLADLRATLEKYDGIAAVLVTPTYSNPLGSCMPEDSRLELLRLAREFDLILIEDDVYGEMSFSGTRPRTIKSYVQPKDDDDPVVFCSSFSKTVAAGFRVGWVVAPPKLYERFILLKQARTHATPTLPEEVLADFLTKPVATRKQNVEPAKQYQRHIEQLRVTLAGQCRLFRDAIAESFPDGTKMTNPTGGCLLWLELPAKVDAVALYDLARNQENVGIAPGTLFAPNQRYRNCVRINLGEPWSSKAEVKLKMVGKLAKDLVVAR